MNLELIHTYFRFFSNKDTDGLADLFAEDIVLKDWEIHGEGKKEVISKNQDIFNSVDTISVEPIHIDLINTTAYCEIEITINNMEKIKVLDIISVDQSGMINLISAYRQF